MEYEFRELEAAQLRVGEDDELEDEISLLQNSEKIYDNLSNAYMISCDDEYSVQTALKKVSDLLAETGEFSQELSELSSRMSELYYEFEDACHSIRDCRDRTVFSPEDLDTAIARIEVLNKLKNKHGRSIAELIEYRDELGEKLSRIENSSDIKEKLESKLLECRKALISACNRLSEARKASAAELETKITSELQQLNFNDADFHISFSTADSFSAAGTDIVEFMITTNKGESLKPLSKIASGGEMSRIMLAFKKIIGDYDEIPTMIFDEIDSGISGIAASIVGRKLKEIAQNHQIICITHLPQIAAFGEHNYRIEKKSDDKMTFTTVTPLSQEGKTDEIARLLGGANITDTTLQSARELIASSETE